MLAIEKPKNPKVIKYIWWDGYNKEEVEKVFPTVGFGRRTVYDEDPCEVGGRDIDIFTLSKKDFEEKYCNLPVEG